MSEIVNNPSSEENENLTKEGRVYIPPADPLESRLEKLIREKNVSGGGEGGSVIIDAILSLNSTNPVQNKVITAAIETLQNNLDDLSNINGITDNGIGNPDDIFDFSRATSTDFKYAIGLYRQGSTNIPDNESDWIIISFRGPSPDNNAEQMAISSGAEICKVYLRNYTSEEWTDWDKFAMTSDISEGSSVEINSKEKDGVVAKGEDNSWNFWGTDNSGNPDWRDINFLSISDIGNGSILYNPQNNTDGKSIKSLKAAIMPFAMFNINVKNYENNKPYENNTKGGIILAFVGDELNDSHLIISFNTGNVYQYNRHLTGKDKCVKLLGGFDYNTKETDGIVKAPEINTKIQPSQILYDAYKTWCLDENCDPKWAFPLINGIESSFKEIFLEKTVRYFGIKNTVVDLDLSKIEESNDVNGLLIDSLLDSAFNKIQIWIGSSKDVGIYYRRGSRSGLASISYSSWHRVLNESDLENVDLSDYAPLDSPEFTGVPTAPTADIESNTDQIATTKFVKIIINSLINGAPETLDTLKELADAITENEDIVESLNAAIGNKVDKEEGKGLSTNDFTDKDREILHTQPDWSVTSSTSPAFIQNKPDLNYLPLSGGLMNEDAIISFIENGEQSTIINKKKVYSELLEASFMASASLGKFGRIIFNTNETSSNGGIIDFKKGGSDYNNPDFRICEFNPGQLSFISDPSTNEGFKIIKTAIIPNHSNKPYDIGSATYPFATAYLKDLNIVERQWSNDDGDFNFYIKTFENSSNFYDERNGLDIEYYNGEENINLYTRLFGGMIKIIEGNYASYTMNVYGSVSSHSSHAIRCGDGKIVFNIGSNNPSVYVSDPYGNQKSIPLGYANKKWKELYAENGTIQTSDKNEKNSFVDLSTEKAESLIYGLKPTTYMMNSGSSGRIHWGLISQDVEELLEKLGWSSLDFAGFIKSPKMTEEEIDEKTGKIIKESEVIEGEYLYSLRYDEFIAPMIKVIQSLNERVKTLEDEIKILKGGNK